MKLNRQSIVWVALGLLALLACAAIAGYPLVPAEVLAGAGMVPLASGTTYEDLEDLLKEQVKKSQDWHNKRKEEFEEVTKRMDDLEMKMNRGKIAGLGMGGDKDEATYFKAVAAFAKSGDERELKNMSVGSDPDGGYVVIPERAKSMIQKLWDMSPMRQLCRTETIGAGDAWEEPVDKGESAATWVGETGARTAGATPQLGMLRVPVHELYALQPITQRLLDDSYLNLGSWIEGKIVDKFDRSEGAAFATGDGIAQPRGFLDYDTAETADATRPWGTIQFKKSGSAAAITADGLKDLVWALRTPYRRGGAAWQMNSNTANSCDKLKDSNGAYIWRNGMQAGEPDTLLGYPVHLNEDMADPAADAFPVALANWQRAYLIVDKIGIRFLRDPFTDKPNVQFYAYRRVGGGLANSEAIKLLKCAA